LPWTAINRGSETFNLKTLIRFFRYLLPRFRCELKTSLDCDEVVERLRKNVSTARLFHSNVYPLRGIVAPPKFRVEPNNEGESSGTNCRGWIERGEGFTWLSLSARLGMAGIFIPLFGLGIVSFSAVVSNAARQEYAMLAAAGTIIITLLIRAYEVRGFWENVNDILGTLNHILQSEEVSRSHTPTGAPIDSPSETEA